MRLTIAVLLALGLVAGAYAQSNPGLTFGQVPTPAQWNSYFAAKQDYLGSSCGPLSGDVTSLGCATTLATVAGAIKSSSPTAGVGYATGAGVAGGQGFSKSTSIGMNGLSGALTMNNASLAAATIVTFAWVNNAVAATDVFVTNHISGGTTGAYTINCRAVSAGNAACDVRNNTAGALAEAIVIQFAIIKAVNN